MRILFWTSLIVFLVDQATKYFVVQWLDLIGKDDGRMSVIPGFIEFRMAWNRGVNFGLFAEFNMRWALIALAVAISIGVLIWLYRSGATKWGYMAAGVLIGGAIGNVVDRLVYGAVADFLNVTCCGIENPFAFNVADIAIFIGAVGLALLPEPKVKPKAGRSK